MLCGSIGFGVAETSCCRTETGELLRRGRLARERRCFFVSALKRRCVVVAYLVSFALHDDGKTYFDSPTDEGGETLYVLLGYGTARPSPFF